MKGSQRAGRLALVLAAGVVGTSLWVPAAGAQEGECITSYASRGRSVVGGQIYGIPYESVSGAPYAENEINSKPQVYAIANNGNFGYVGEVVIGTAVPGAVPANPTEAKSIWPPAGESANGPSYRSDAKALYGPFAQAVSKAEPRKGMAEASMFGEKGTPFNRARAAQVAEFDGKTLKGTDEAIGYNLQLGPVSIDKMRSIVHWESDGTEEGSKATWTLEFSGVGSDKDKVYTITREGFAGGGGQPSGADMMKQFNDGADEFSKALEQAGIGRSETTIAPGELEVRPGYLRYTVAGFEMRGYPAFRDGQIGHQMSMVYGFHDRLVEVRRGDCFSDVNLRQPGEVEQPKDKSVVLGPMVMPDPTPPGYGGPKSTQPIPGTGVAIPAVAPAPAPARPAVIAAGPPPAPTAVPTRSARAWF
jgi:hypothetical protein